ncbi:MAG: hypothetical protein KGQ66_01680 [Acidobacteriota bacterium]|nr:hypothetical protein [Acidobacteriota bacterium]
MATASMLIVLFGVGGVAVAQSVPSGAAPAAIHASQSPPPDVASSAGTTVDPLLARCGYDSPTCGTATGTSSSGASVGETYAGLNGSIVNLLYTQNFYCDSTDFPSHDSNGCEAGAGPGTAATTSPPATPPPDNTRNAAGNFDTLYIPVPLFANPPSLQCNGKATCVDHPGSLDLSALASTLGVSDPTTLYSAMLPGHDHIVATRNSGLPEWWNVVVVGVTNSSAFNAIESAQDVATINQEVASSSAVLAPSNVYLFFQVMPGTVAPSTYGSAAAGDFSSTAPNGPAPTDSNNADVESGASINNLIDNCSSDGINCQGVGRTSDWISGQDVSALYTENFFCDTSVSSSASDGCEAGASAQSNPPGVGGAVPSSSNSYTGTNIDPLYIPVPLYSPGPTHPLQCNAGYTCIDHPPSIDLSRLAPVLGVSAAQLASTPIPGHDHILTTRNQNQPEWWDVVVVGVKTPAAFQAIEAGKSLQAVDAQVTAGGAVIAPTNAYLWFQTLPGVAPASPGPVTTNCQAHLPAGSVVGMAPLSDGNGYVETDAAGDVAVFGQAACYGSLTGIPLNKPIVGVAVDKYTGGYWLVAADGGVFSFNAAYMGSTGDVALAQPIVGMAATPDAGGYWLVASDGGVFSFGDAVFHGSTGGVKLDRPVVGMTADPATGGYWLVASDGGIFAFGAPFEGSTGGVALTKPVVGMAPTVTGQGYHLFASDGGVFSFGDAGFYGSTGGVSLAKPVTGGGADLSTGGYWEVATDGGLFSFNAPFWGSAA